MFLTINITPPINGGTINIANVNVTTAGTNHAPAMVWVEASGITGADVSEVSGDNYDPSYHDITYVWTIRGQPLSAFSAPQNMVSGWNNPNVMYGKHAAFYIPTAGTYDIDLWCVDRSGNTGTATTQVVVTSPSYSAANTIVIALDGDFTGAPASTAQVTSIAAAETALNGRTNPTRVSFKPGETHTAFAMKCSDGRLEYVDTWTVGQKVTLDVTPSAPVTNSGFWHGVNNGAMTQMTFRDLNLQGSWDTKTETGYRESSFFTFARVPQRCDFILADCQFKGMKYVDNTLRDYGGVLECRLMMANCAVLDWQGYGIGNWPNSDTRGYMAYIGNRFVQDPLSLAGGPKTGMRNDHGAMRISNAKHLILSQNDVFVMGGWSGSPAATNAALRLFSTVFPDSSSVVERNVIESGYVKIKMDGQNDIEEEYGGNHLIERNLMIGSARTYFFISVHYGGSTIRNNLAYMPNKTLFESPPRVFAGFQPDNPQASNQRPFKVYNNSFITEETDLARSLYNSTPTYYNDYTAENNIYYTLGSTSDGPIDFTTTMTGITPRFAQVRYNFQMFTSTFPSDITNGNSFTIPYSSFDSSVGFSHPVLNTGSTAPTDQAYWQAAEAAGDTLHMMRPSPGGEVIYAALGQFSVSYADANNVTITNTSGATWTTGTTFDLRLDRKSLLDTYLPAATSYASGSTIPVCKPQSGSGAENAASAGYVAYYDMFGTTRSTPAEKGASEV